MFLIARQTSEPQRCAVGHGNVGAFDDLGETRTRDKEQEQEEEQAMQHCSNDSALLLRCYLMIKMDKLKFLTFQVQTMILREKETNVDLLIRQRRVMLIY